MPFQVKSHVPSAIYLDDKVLSYGAQKFNQVTVSGTPTTLLNFTGAGFIRGFYVGGSAANVLRISSITINVDGQGNQVLDFASANGGYINMGMSPFVNSGSNPNRGLGHGMFELNIICRASCVVSITDTFSGAPVVTTVYSPYGDEAPRDRLLRDALRFHQYPVGMSEETLDGVFAGNKIIVSTLTTADLLQGSGVTGKGWSSSIALALFQSGGFTGSSGFNGPSDIVDGGSGIDGNPGFTYGTTTNWHCCVVAPPLRWRANARASYNRQTGGGSQFWGGGCFFYNT